MKKYTTQELQENDLWDIPTSQPNRMTIEEWEKYLGLNDSRR